MAVIDNCVAHALDMIAAGRRGEALLALNQLAATEHGEAVRILGELRWGGEVDPDPAAAPRLFERAAHAGDATARFYVTNLLASGIAGPRNWALAIERLRGEARRDPSRTAAFELVERMKLDGSGDPVVLRAGEQVSKSPNIVRHQALFTSAECA